MGPRPQFRPLPFVVLTTALTGLAALPAMAVAQEPEVAADSQPRPIEIVDALAWNRIGSTAVSNDGRWFVYRLVPNEGDGEVVLRSTVGEAPGFAGSLAFSEDSRWLAFVIYPDRAAARRLEKEKEPARNKVGLVELATGELTEFEDVRAFQFAGEAGGWIALHRYAPQGLLGGRNSGERARGSDLLLYELESGAQLSIGNVSEFAFDESGRRLAWLIDTDGQAGNGVQLRDMQTGVVRVLESDEAAYRRLNWTDEGDGLAALKGVEDEDYEDPLYSLVGFHDFGDRGPTKVIYDPQEDPDFPEGMTISPNRDPEWTEPLDAILFGIHEVELKESAEEDEEEEGEGEGEGEEEEEEEETPARRGAAEEDEEEMPDLVIWHWQDERLQSMQQVQEGRDKEFSYLSLYRVAEDRFIRLADDNVRQVTASPKGRWAIGYDDDDYELMGNLDGRRYRDVYAIDMRSGERSLALEGNRWAFGLAPDGGHLLYYGDGQFHTYEMAGGRHYTITQEVPASFINTENDRPVVDPPIYPIGWTSDSRAVLLYDNWDIWRVAVHGDRGTNLTVNGKTDGIRYRRRFVLDPDEEGIDLSEPIYLAPYGEWTKKAGLGRINRGRPGVELLAWDDAGYGSLIKAEDADTYLFTRDTYEDFPNYHVTDTSFRQPRQITDANPQQSEFTWTAGSMLLDYESEHGDRLQAALHLPADYEEGKSYPTIVYIYERMSQTLNRYTTPSARGFNKSVYTSNGYAVLMPDITYRVDDPGMSAVWCVLPALQAAIETGIVDPERVGLQGHSWGGYQTAFLITQTDAFAAALAGAPLTNMVSMYSSIYWNTGSANQPIFESSQGRFSGGYWDVPEAYTRNSPVYFAENVTTPLLLLHNDEDGAVDWNQGIEYFNTLRRLEKPVVMLQYVGENHGVRKPENQKDYTVRMREFFDHYLKGEPAPDWWTEGVPHLEMEEHLEERAKLVKEGREEGT